jgi:hypothetical protein
MLLQLKVKVLAAVYAAAALVLVLDIFYWRP